MSKIKTVNLLDFVVEFRERVLEPEIIKGENNLKNKKWIGNEDPEDNYWIGRQTAFNEVRDDLLRPVEECLRTGKSAK